MASSVTAILVVHDEAVLAQRALAAIKNQTAAPNQILVVDSSKAPVELYHPTIRVGAKSRLGEIVNTALATTPASGEHWLWIVHDDSDGFVQRGPQLLLVAEHHL